MWNDISTEEAPGRLSTPEALGALETQFGVSLPPDHRDFLLRFGEGVVFNHIRIFSPERAAAATIEARSRWQEFFLWDEEDSALDEAALARCIIVGDTFNGDEFVLSPGPGSRLYYLPQDDFSAVDLGESLEAGVGQVVTALREEVAGYPEEEREEWDLRPVFSLSSF